MMPMQPVYPMPNYGPNEGSSVGPILLGVGVVGLIAVGGYFAYTKLSAPASTTPTTPTAPIAKQQPVAGQTPSTKPQQTSQPEEDPFGTRQTPKYTEVYDEYSEPQSTKTEGWPSGSFGIAPKSDNSYVMDVPGNSKFIMTELQLWKDHGGDNQRFTYDKNTKQIKTKNGLAVSGGMLINAPGQSGDRIIQTAAVGDSGRQRWDFNPSTGEMKLDGTNLCLDLDNGKKSDGAKLLIWNCHGGDNQKWTLKQ